MRTVRRRSFSVPCRFSPASTTHTSTHTDKLSSTHRSSGSTAHCRPLVLWVEATTQTVVDDDDNHDDSMPHQPIQSPAPCTHTHTHCTERGRLMLSHASSFRSQSNGKRSNRFITIVVHCHVGGTPLPPSPPWHWTNIFDIEQALSGVQ